MINMEKGVDYKIEKLEKGPLQRFKNQNLLLKKFGEVGLQSDRAVLTFAAHKLFEKSILYCFNYGLFRPYFPLHSGQTCCISHT